jgi:hypothetical protein
VSRGNRSVRDALRFVASHPVSTLEPVETPTWELIARTLFEVANSPNAKVRGSMVRATKAQRMIAERLVGTRRPGTHPAVAREGTQINFVDLTVAALEAPDDQS